MLFTLVIVEVGWQFDAKYDAMHTFKVTILLAGAMLNSSFGQQHPVAPDKNVATASARIDGDYVGLEPIASVTPNEPAVKWFHENRLVVRNNEAILDKVPVSIAHGEKSYSASDGGFLIYRGRFFKNNGGTFVSLRLFEIDYVLVPVGGCEPYSKIEVLPVKIASGEIEIRGVRYKPNALSQDTQDRLLRMLSREPMEYTGLHPFRKDLKLPSCR